MNTPAQGSVPAPVAALFPPGGERARLEEALGRALAAARTRVAAGPTVPTIDLAAFRRDLARFRFEDPQPLEALMDWSIDVLEHGINHITHPRYFGLYNPAPSFPAECADRIVNTFNPQLASSATSPAAVAIEAHVIGAIARRAGFPDTAGGHFTTGGSEANYTAMLCALTRAHPGFAADGARAFPGAPVLYTSRECHRSWVKIAHQAGIGRSAARLVETDGTGRMSIAALKEALARDLAEGHVPVLIVASAGTTGAGMIDPLPECADLASAHGLWLHVDAAWGGAAIASDTHRHVLAGLERADSATIDAHKWFATTMGCGMVLVRDPAALTAAFNVAASFMPSHVPSTDPYLNTVQWSRRFVGLRLFLSLATAGWSGHGAHVDRAVAQAAVIREGLRAAGWSILNESPLAVLAAVPPPGDRPVADIVRAVVSAGLVWVSVASFENRDVVRICVTHGGTTADDLRLLVDGLVAAGRG